MRLRLACVVAALLLALMTRPAPAADAYQAVDAFEVEGAFGLIIVPASWNGSFIAYAHGYDPDYRNLKPYPDDITPANVATKLAGADAILQIPLSLGYAVGTTRYRSVGWAVDDGWRDVDNVRRRFRRRFGKPKHTYVFGHSEGGLITQAVIEKRPRAYDGALPLCAPGAGGRRNLLAAWDLRVVYEYVCGDVPGAAFRCNLCSDGKSRCMVDADCPAGGQCGGMEPAYPPEWGLTPECTEVAYKGPGAVNPVPRYVELTAQRTTACFGGAVPSPAEQARRDLFLRLTRIPESFLLTDLVFAAVAIGEVRNRRTNGGVPWSNVGVTYRSPTATPVEEAAFNAAAVRATNDIGATRFLRRAFEPHGLTYSRVLTLHNLDDGLALVENEDKYREAFATVNREDRLVQLYTPTGGHCGFSDAEHAAALRSLFAWVEEDRVPTASSVQSACAGLGGPCRVQDADPGHWGDRVVERLQRGVPIDSLVCDGDAVDCPAETTCAVSRGRCGWR